ncbi:hypothetical protein KC323_g311 [Hortaea werneckii]|nr:hypothetical protein KC323_g311 [Hortaea werneckii]
MPAYHGLDLRQSPRFVVGYRHVGVVVDRSGTRPGQSFAPGACNVDVAVSSATHRLQKAGGSESVLVEVLPGQVCANAEGLLRHFGDWPQGSAWQNLRQQCRPRASVSAVEPFRQTFLKHTLALAPSAAVTGSLLAGPGSGARETLHSASLVAQNQRAQCRKDPGEVGECRFLIRRTGWTASLDVGSRADERDKRLSAACRSRVKDKATGDLHSPRPTHPVTSLSTPIPHHYGGAVIQCNATGCTQPHGNEAQPQPAVRWVREMVTPRDKESRQPIRGEARSHLAHVKIARFRERGLEWMSAVRDPSASRGPCSGEKQPEKDESDVICSHYSPPPLPQHHPKDLQLVTKFVVLSWPASSRYSLQCGATNGAFTTSLQGISAPSPILFSELIPSAFLFCALPALACPFADPVFCSFCFFSAGAGFSPPYTTSITPR